MNLKIVAIMALCLLSLSCKSRNSTAQTKSDVAIAYTARPGVNLYLFKIPNLPIICRGLCSSKINPASIDDASARRQACSQENFMITLDDLALTDVKEDQKELFSQLVAELKSDKDSGRGSLVFKPEFEPLVKTVSDRIYAKGIKDGCSKWIGVKEIASDRPVQTRDEPAQTPQAGGGGSNCVGTGMFKYCVQDLIYSKEGSSGLIDGIFGDGRLAWQDRRSGTHYVSPHSGVGVTKGCSTSTPSFCIGDLVVYDQGGSGNVLALFQDGTIMWQNTRSGTRYISTPGSLAVTKK